MGGTGYAALIRPGASAMIAVVVGTYLCNGTVGSVLRPGRYGPGWPPPVGCLDSEGLIEADEAGQDLGFVDR